MPITHKSGGPTIELTWSLPSELAAISPFVDKLMLLISKFGRVPEGNIENALREAIANAIIHGNHQNPESTLKSVAAVSATEFQSR